MTILVTGGAGYIGSHTLIALAQAGFDFVVVDNLSNSSTVALNRVEKIIGRSIPFYECDIANADALNAVFNEYAIKAVIHFAGLKAVGESVAKPLLYYRNNVVGTVSLCEVMQANGVHHILFSSSATVYGDPASVPITEQFPTSTTNPYGASKLMVEDILRDVCAVPNSPWRVSLLRYFNPIGAHESGTIGEDPKGIPNNLLPYVAQVAVGRLPKLGVFGDDYPTPDGTGVRDYIHVVDLANGHVKALAKLLDAKADVYTYNLGTGQGYSVKQIIAAFEKTSQKEIAFEIKPRRAGDIATCYADAALANTALGWQAEFGIERMIEDTWRWQKNNPNGYV